MTSRFLNLAFTPSVKAAQTANGSREAYARRDGAEEPDRLTENEVAFIATRDSFYMATAGSNGWPYIQHRGGPPGFVKVLGERTLGIADFRGNRQYVSVGNLADDDRAALFFMDYARQARLKMLCRARFVAFSEHPELAATLTDVEYGAKIERGLIFEIEAFDWNCKQHITERYTVGDITPTIDVLKSRIAELEAEVERLKPAG